MLIDIHRILMSHSFKLHFDAYQINSKSNHPVSGMLAGGDTV
jgi:hypothetical protein